MPARLMWVRRLNVLRIVIRSTVLGSIKSVSRSISIVLGSFVALSACNQTPERKSTPAPVASASARHATAPRAENPRDINALFRVEAENRPQSAPRVEDAMAAFRAAGVAVQAERQHLARPYGARYCVGAESGPDLALSVCEYIDAAAAAAGVATSRKMPLKNREIRVQGATSLTVRLIKSTAEARAVEARLFQAFAKL